jgi:hypothetical protein
VRETPRVGRRRYSRPTLQCASEAALIGKAQLLAYFVGGPPGDTDSVGVGVCVARFRQAFRASSGPIGAPFMATLLVNSRRTAIRVRRQVPTVASGGSSHQAIATS